MKNIFLLLLTFVSLTTFAQKPAMEIANGNKKFNMRNYADAEALFRSAASKDAKSTEAAYDKGNAIYRQYQSNESILSYHEASKIATTKEDKHRVNHNLGNAYMKQKNYGAAVESYKEALRNNPNDDETRYNFALAKMMQEKNKDKNDQNKDDKNKNKDKDKDKDKKDDKNDKDKEDKEDKNKDKDDKDKGKNDEKKDDKGDQPEKRNPEQQKQEQSKQQMENILNALNNQEKKVRQRIQDRDKEAKPVKSNAKDW